MRDAVEIVVNPDEDKVRQLMGHCSVIASASEYEGFGVAAVEGMSAGLFPVAERHSDVPPPRHAHGRRHARRFFRSRKRRPMRSSENGERSKPIIQLPQDVDRRSVGV